MRRLQAIAQNGLHYDPSPFMAGRFEEVRRIAAELAACEVEEVGFFVRDALPELSGRSPRERLPVVFDHASDPSLPTWFA